MNIFCLFLSLITLTPVSAGILDDLPTQKHYKSARISSTDPWGGNGDGSQWNPLKRKELRTIADIKGPGEISHIWFTFSKFDKDTLQNVVIRAYWDGEQKPSIEAPIGAFFGLGHGKDYSFDSIPISVANNRGLNCFFPMPFKSRARITIENQSSTPLEALYYYIDYKKFDRPRSDLLYFHAQYRQQKPALNRSNYIALEATGRGHYVGMFYYILGNSGGWWGEGDDMIFIDGDTKPTLAGTGMEDYFCNAWGMKEGQNYLRFGAPLWEVTRTGPGNENTAYRWHLDDPIVFTKSLKVSHEHGSNNDRNDDFFSVAFWYQTHPHATFPTLPPPFQRLSFQQQRDQLIKSKQYAKARALLQPVIDSAVDEEVRASAVADTVRTYVLQGNPSAAENLLQSGLGPLPLKGLQATIENIVKEFNLKAPDYGAVRAVACVDGHALIKRIYGKTAFCSDRANRSPYLYFRVEDATLRGIQTDLTIELQYTGGGTLVVEYTTADDAYKKCAPVILNASPGWHTVRIALPGATLAGSQSCDSDIRAANTTGELTISSASVTRSATP